MVVHLYLLWQTPLRACQKVIQFLLTTFSGYNQYHLGIFWTVFATSENGTFINIFARGIVIPLGIYQRGAKRNLLLFVKEDWTPSGAELEGIGYLQDTAVSVCVFAV
jgi:hypothetical protein